MDILIFNAIFRANQRCWKAVVCILGFYIVWPLCVHGEFRDVLSNNNISNFAVFFIFINTNNARRDRDWTILVQVFISISSIYVTCEILIYLVHN